MKKSEQISRRQLLALGFASVLSPLIRVVPTRSIELAGFHSWLSSIISIVPLLLIFWIINRTQKSLPEGEGLTEAFVRNLGKGVGGAFLILLALWLTFYTGFIMRASADRFVSTIYPESTPSAFIPMMGILAIFVGMGTVKALARSAEIVLPLLLVTLLFVFVFAVGDVEFSSFVSPELSDAPQIFRGAFPVINALGVAVFAYFLNGYVPRERAGGRAETIYIAVAVLVSALLCALVSGTLGTRLSAELNHPFFVLIRNIKVFNMLERIEAIIIAIWYFTDFLLIGLLIQAVCNIIEGVFGKRGRKTLLAIITVLLATLTAFFVAPTSLSLWELSFVYVPIINLFVVYILLPLVFLVGVLRKRV